MIAYTQKKLHIKVLILISKLGLISLVIFHIIIIFFSNKNITHLFCLIVFFFDKIYNVIFICNFLFFSCSFSLIKLVIGQSRKALAVLLHLSSSFFLNSLSFALQFVYLFVNVLHFFLILQLYIQSKCQKKVIIRKFIHLHSFGMNV